MPDIYLNFYYDAGDRRIYATTCRRDDDILVYAYRPRAGAIFTAIDERAARMLIYRCRG